MKSMIINALGDIVVNNYLPMSATNADAFATKYLDGTWKVLLARPDVGTDTALLAYDTKVFVKNSASGVNGYFNMIVKSTVSETDIKTALMGITVNGGLVDHVSVISFAPITFA
ncbi:MAG: hypothetical protein NTY39_03450 [Campylobacterales bacterium]|nr:hypothetical protein [Campylobacterales bacterium]